MAHPHNARDHIESLLRVLRAARKQVHAGKGPDRYRTVGGLYDTQRREELLKQLAARPAGMDFRRTPLGDVIETLRRQHDIELQVDWRTVGAIGIPGDTKVTIRNNGPLGAALTQLLEPLDLDWVVEDDIVRITTSEICADRLTTRVYPVGDLVTNDPRDEPDFDPLMEVLREAVVPNEFCPDGRGSLIRYSRPPCLVAVLKPRVHKQIKAILARLRAPRRRRTSGSEKGER